MSASFLAAWWMQGTVIAALLAVTAAVLQWIARDTVPARAIWGVALLGATVLTCIAPFRLQEPLPGSGPIVVQGTPLRAAIAESRAFDIASVARVVSENVRAVLEAPMRRVADAVREIPNDVARGALGAWAMIALALLTMLSLSHRRLRRLLSAAESCDIAGVPVRLTADLGPAVVGVRAPVVAVPRWLLDLPAAEQALVVRHEQSHVAARDPLLLMSGVALAALQPWNPFVWLMLSRLRLAIELDCDRRLLRHGTSPRAYGDLLIALSAAVSPTRRPALIHPMFSIHRSHLAQRIIAMTERPVRLINTRRVAVVALAALAFVAACESRLPTDAEVREMDAASAVRTVAGTAMIDPSKVTFYVDGVRASESDAKAIPANRITGLSVQNGRSEVHITTGAPLPSVEERRLVVRDTASNAVIVHRAPGEGEFMRGFTGVLVIDGEVVDKAKFGELTPDRIESVSVLKGQSAISLYGTAAANGVISVKTKPRR